VNLAEHRHWVAEGSPAVTTPMYWMYEMAQASLNPARAVTTPPRSCFKTRSIRGRTPSSANRSPRAAKLFERTTRRYGKPEWNLPTTKSTACGLRSSPPRIWEKPFLRLLYLIAS